MSLATPTAAFDSHTTLASRDKDDVALSSSSSSVSDEDASVSDVDVSDEDASVSDVDVSDVIAEKKQTRQGKDWRPKSTLHLKIQRGDKLSIVERLAAMTLMPESYYELKDESLDRGPVPSGSLLGDHAWIIARSCPPLVLHQLSMHFFPTFHWPAPLAYLVYTLFYADYLRSIIGRCGKLALKYGTLDEKNIGRDRVPDAALTQLATGYLAYVIVRPLGEFILSWDAAVAPLSSFRLSTPLRYIAYLLVMDYFFYVYHRSCHEIDWLWKIHSKHHTTKHPSPTLSILADEWQEVIEIALCPLAAALLVPMSHAELYLLMAYVGYVEALGHSGIRCAFDSPILGLLLRSVGCELVMEDHDLHHRYGKSGKNYGKQSRLWDIIFDTTTPREEFANMPGYRPY